MKDNRWTMLLLLLLLWLAVACSSNEASNAGSAQAEAPAADGVSEEDGEAVARPEGWSEESHGNDAQPDYEVVFPQDKVNQLTITIDPENWAAMQANMTDLLGEKGTGQQPGGPPGFGPPPDGESPESLGPPQGFAPPTNGELPEGFQRPQGVEPAQGERVGGPGGAGPGGKFASENPMWVPATIEFEDQTWTHVGVRYKGNSSLSSAWNSGSLKLPLKLDFDEFEDEYPEIDDQRFYGFKQLSLANGFGDDTYMRDTISYDLLEDAGLVAAETAYYEVILDYGEGPVSLGLYTMIEVIDDTVIDRTFGDDDGNIYEGDGPAASLAEGTFEQIASSFQKENNKDEADYSDIEALYEVLHSQKRTTDPEAWRADLEAVFDVDTFVEWLALSSVIQHWDSYGRMSHNYYLYHDPASDRLTWISWDHNLVLGALGGGAGPGATSSDSLDKADVGDDWPLIRYLLDDAAYYEAYIGCLEETTALFDPDEMAAKYEKLAALIQPYVAAEEGAQRFEAAVQQLLDITYERHEAAVDFLASQ